MKKNKIRKKWLVLGLSLLIFLFLVFGMYGYCLKSVSKTTETVHFVLESGTSKIKIAEDLKKAGLIKSKYALLAYLFFNSDLNLQAGTYILDRNMSAPQILEKFHTGDVKIETVTFTFIEGKNMRDFISLIAREFPYTKEEVEATLKDKEFINELIQKYDFLTDDILNDNIYYALEGYLYPDTYEMYKTTSIKDIIIRILDHTKAKFATIDFSTSNYTIHEILSMASIVELEALTDVDRQKVAQVIFKRLEMGKGLGMDPTTKYAVKKDLNEVLTMSDLKTINPYNTSESNPSMAGKIPVGPICNPTLSSIQAVLNPSDTEYVFFVANTCTKEIFFTETFEEHAKKTKELREICETN